MSGISRRDILRNIAVGAAGGSVLQMIPAQAAQLAHELIQKERASSPVGFRKSLVVAHDAVGR